jgi:alkylation response protein AidB-like acyl-CoA dehydrogenase
MLNFAPTEEQEEIRSLALSLALDHLRAQGRASERDGDIAPSLLRTLAQTGLTAPFPEHLGGSGALEAVTYTLIAEELGFGDGALAMNVISSLMGPLAVWLAGDERQQQEYIAPFCDENGASDARGSFAYAERTGGYQLADIAATARREGDVYIVNGTKREVIHGSATSPHVVLLRLEGTSGYDGLLALLVPAEGAGIQVRNDSQKLGLIAAPSASYDFDNARIPADCQLGAARSNGVIRAATLYNILRAGVACGMARAALEYARDYARERIAFGRPIASYQGIAFMVAEMAMNLDAARLTTWRAASEWDTNGGEVELATLVRDAEAAQRQAVKIAKSATLDAIQVLGGAGFIQDHPVEMWARNAAAME